ncbi:TPA: glycosyltransferase family 2 protein, partial [Enterobacter cloacae]
MKAPVLSIVVPCYNEQDVFSLCLEELTSRIDEMIDKGKIHHDSHIVFVDDGSKDETWNLIQKESAINNRVKGVKLSRNKGHQIALMAGLSSSTESDITVSIDADLQDDTSVIEEMVDLFISGKDIVYGVRNDRNSDSFFKKFTAELFYKT